LKEQILLLVELQNIDLEMEKLMLKKVDLPKEIARLDEELDAIKRELEEDGQRLDKLKADHRAKETAMKNSGENSKKAKSRLLGVKTNKEYEATLKEIDAINEKSSRIEDEIIHILEEIDKVHRARLSKVADDKYFACADFTTKDGKVYDLDVFMVGPDKDSLEFSEFSVHKEDGVERYTWYEEDGLWKKKDVTDSN